MMARPTPTSAAATAMTNRAKTWPGHVACAARPKATRLMLTDVEDQLDRHQHHHAVAAGEHAVDADAEQDGREEEELVDEHQSRLARTMAPMSAASRSTETTSKGTR